MFGFLEMIGNYESRKVANTKIEEGIVDTCSVTDSAQPFETGIQSHLYNDGEWVIVESYDTKEEASEGHEKWVKILASKPETLQDNGQSEVVQFAKALGADLNKEFPKKA